MKSRAHLTGVLTLGILLTSIAAADECQLTTSEPYLAAAGHYLVIDCGIAVVGPECDGPAFDALGIWWVYEEANGVAGLQRNDDIYDDTCGGLYPSDKIVL